MSAGIIISVILILALLAAGIVFLILFLREKNKKKTEDPDVSITGTQFKLLTGDTSVEASWDSVGNDDDEVTLYASTKSISIDNKTGQPIGDVLSSSTVKGNTTKLVTVKELKTKTTYYLSLVVYNKTSNVINETIFTDSTLEGEFAIQDIAGNGYIILETGNTSVRLDTAPKVLKTDVRDIWEYDAGQFGTPPTYYLISKVNNSQNIVLYSDKSVLKAKDRSKLTPAEIKNAQWEYIPDTEKGKSNTTSQWCLKNATTRTCMSVKGTITVKSPDSLEITVGAGSKSSFKNIPIV